MSDNPLPPASGWTSSAYQIDTTTIPAGSLITFAAFSNASDVQYVNVTTSNSATGEGIAATNGQGGSINFPISGSGGSDGAPAHFTQTYSDSSSTAPPSIGAAQGGYFAMPNQTLYVFFGSSNASSPPAPPAPPDYLAASNSFTDSTGPIWGGVIAFATEDTPSSGSPVEDYNDTLFTLTWAEYFG